MCAAAYAGWWNCSAPAKTNLTVMTASSLTEAFTDLGNRLCLITYSKQTKVAHLADLSKPGVKLLVGVPNSPIGKYTVQTFQKMAADADYGSAVVTKVEANVVSEETNVKLVLTKVKLGEADAGFVYASDAIGQGVKVITSPEDIRVKATYLIGLGARSKQPA